MFLSTSDGKKYYYEVSENPGQNYFIYIQFVTGSNNVIEMLIFLSYI
jgi:hypothetical protein